MPPRLIPGFGSIDVPLHRPNNNGASTVPRAVQHQQKHDDSHVAKTSLRPARLVRRRRSDSTTPPRRHRAGCCPAAPEPDGHDAEIIPVGYGWGEGAWT